MLGRAEPLILVLQMDPSGPPSPVTAVAERARGGPPSAPFPWGVRASLICPLRGCAAWERQRRAGVPAGAGAEGRRGGTAPNRAAGVVVSCKIPILATRVRFPGGAVFLFPPLRLFRPRRAGLHPRRGAVPGAAVPRHAGPGGRGAEQGPDPGGAAGVRGAGRAAGAGGGRGRGAARRALRAGAAAGALAALGHRPAGAAQHRCLRGGHRVAQPAAPHPAGRVTGLGELGGHGARHPGPHREHQHDAHLRAAVHAGPVPGCRRAAEAWRCALHLWALRRGWPDQPPEQRGLRPQPEAEQSRLGAAGHGAAAGAGRGQRAVPGEDGGHAGQQQEPDLPQAVTRPDSTSSASHHCCSH